MHFLILLYITPSSSQRDILNLSLILSPIRKCPRLVTRSRKIWNTTFNHKWNWSSAASSSTPQLHFVDGQLVSITSVGSLKCLENVWEQGGTGVRTLASYQCGMHSNPRPGVKHVCGLSMSLVLILVPRVFSRFYSMKVPLIINTLLVLLTEK